MPQKCFFKPNRTKPRLWTAKTVGQVACLAIRQGNATREELIDAVLECSEEEKTKRASAAEALAVAEQELTNSNSLFDADAVVMQRFLAVLNIFTGLVFRIVARIPRVGPGLAVAIPALRQLASARLKQLTVQKAANDRAIRIVREAAANESRFLRSGTQ